MTRFLSSLISHLPACPGEVADCWTLDAWRAARELGLKVQVNTTVTGHNLTDLADIAALVSRLGAVRGARFCWCRPGAARCCPH